MRSHKGLVAGLFFGGLVLALAISPFSRYATRYDFGLRIAEVTCLRQGVNPFDVWSERVVLRPYVSNSHKGPNPEGCNVLINAYAPWVYALMLPFSYLPPDAAWAVYVALMTAALLCVFIAGILHLRSLGHTGSEAVVCMASAAGLVSHALWSNVGVGNFAVFTLAGAVMAGVCLQRRRDILAGVFLSLAMLKPQLSLLLFVPVLMRGRLVACAVSAAICFAASILPAWLCRASVFEMLFQGPAANVEFFNGCGTWPKFLCGTFGPRGDIVAGALIGLAVCIWLTWLLRRERDWLVYIMPAAVCSSCWTYAQGYSHVMGAMFAYVVVSGLFRAPRDRVLWAIAALSVPVVSRPILAWHGYAAVFGPEFPMSEYAFRVADSVNSTLSLVLVAALCIHRSRQGGDNGDGVR